MEEGYLRCCDAEVIDGGCDCEGEIEQSVAEEWAVDEVAIEPAECVEGGREVVASAPYVGRIKGEGGAIAGEAAEGGRDADGASRVGANRGEGGAFLDAGGGTAGGASGEMRWVERLDAVAEVAVLSGDAVGELVEIRFASDDGSGSAKASGDCAVGGGDAVVVAVELGAAGGRETREVEAVFERDRNSPERLVGDVFAAEIARFVAGPVFVLEEVDVVASVAVSADECGV